ncbi:MAG: lipid A export permease/ATP-binding protein MsbA [Gammaproteobacteria bacterium]|nr:lipid A export permease/ATP-binding protein MsbA [Gammaproteobacteria bacterium]
MQNRRGLHTYLRLLSYVRSYIWPFLISILGFMLFAWTMPAFAKLIELFIEGLQEGTDKYLYYVPMLAMGIAVLRGIGFFLGNYYLAKVSLGVVHDLRVDLFNKLLELPNSYFDRNNSGHLISRITYNVTMVTGAATDSVKTVIREGLTVMGLLVYLLWSNWKLTLVFLVVMVIMSVIVSQVGKRLRKLSHKIQNAMGEVTHVSSETINGYQVVRSYGGEEYERKRFWRASYNNLRQSMKMTRVGAINTPVLQFLVLTAMAVIMFMVLYMRYTDSVAALVAFVLASSMMPKPLRQLSEVYGNIQKGIAACETIFDQLDEQIEEDTGTTEVERVAGRIQFKGVEFSYPGVDSKVLKGIDLVIEPGETVAFVGRSGSGKTTITSLLLRFYNATAGAILVDGVPVQEYRLHNLREQIAMVGQNTTLFNDTVARNIAYGSLERKDEVKITQAAESAYAMEFIQKMEHGVDTLIGEDGVLLSGGQRQRLAIARAFLKDAPILILDEATSALDTESEKNIQEALKDLSHGRTTLVVAHRLSTIEGADRIVVLNDGEIVESGRHEELLALGGEYTSLYQTQFKSQDSSVPA